MAPSGWLPPHRPHRADFPQRFLKRDSLLKSRATDPRLRQRVAAEKGVIVLPRQPRPARSAIEPLVPEFAGAPIELPETSGIRGSPIVLIVAPELGIAIGQIRGGREDRGSRRA